MKKLLLASLTINVLLLLVLVGFGILFAKHTIIVAPKSVPAAQKAVVQKVTLGKSWDLPATSSAKATLITLTVTTAEKTDKIVSGGKSFTTKNNKSFLIVNTMVVNQAASSVTIGPSDFVKLMSDGKEIAPLYQAIPSSIAASKTYDSSMVFLVDANQSSFVLSVGTNVNKTTTLPFSF